jgi:hypothetical protein
MDDDIGEASSYRKPKKMVGEAPAKMCVVTVRSGD